MIPFSISMLNQHNYSMFQIFFDTAYLAAIAIPHFIAAFFCVVVKILSLYLKEISSQITKEQLKNLKYPSLSSESPPFKKKMLSILRKHHVLVYQVIRQINRSLGLFLLIQFIKTLTGIINSFASIPIDSVEKKWFFIIVPNWVVFRKLLDILAVTSSADSIQSKVPKLTQQIGLTFFEYLFISSDISWKIYKKS